MASTERVPFLDELDCRSYFSQKFSSKLSNPALFKISKPRLGINHLLQEYRASHAESLHK